MKIANFTDIKTIFFGSKTVKQTIFKNTLWIGISVGISKLLTLLLVIYLARILGATEYGKFTFAAAFVSLFVIFSDFGLSHVITREFSGNKEREREFSSILSLRFFLSLGALFLIVLSSFFVTDDSAIRSLIWILAGFSLINGFSEIIFAFFRARQRMEYESWATIAQALVVTGAGFFVLFNFPSIRNLSYGYLFSAFVGLAAIVTLFHVKVHSLTVSFDRSIWRKFLLMSWPLLFIGVFGAIYNYMDSVMMGYWGQVTETGWYNAAYRITLIATVPMGIIALNFYPVLSKLFKESREKLQSIWNYQMELMILLAVPLVVGGHTLAAKIIHFIYGQSFNPSVLAFQILLAMVGFMFLSRPLEQILIVSHQQKKIFLATLFGAFINIILNFILIPRFSLYGAATATVITFLLMLFLLFYFTSQFTSIRPLNVKFLYSFATAGFSSMIMYFSISLPQIYSLNLFFTVAIGVFIYSAVLFGLKLLIHHISRSYTWRTR